MKKTGIWLDMDKALIVTIENNKDSFITITSDVEHFHQQGSFGNRITRNPLDIIKESSILERKQQQLKAYFKEIVSYIKDTDALVIIGPAQTYKRFKSELDENYNTISKKIKAVKKVDSMTDNQVKAWVKEFFKEKSNT
ncbi:hypothetical protein RXV94_05990 [Yeosuana sp. MJ-SS3]|uniref:Host attachment protein n=1 Tax=Gilvirhabdus luticola TaxID=3079858 RepID=A0ABU3U5M4_9FLAO|nr:hypothetical protein [Yeosuana sp. MJ-SS3]MDU8885703.1 hypothetical protein [Yeosuana sp. MJ-SS3]